MAEIIQYVDLKRKNFKEERNLIDAENPLLERLKAKYTALLRLKKLQKELEEKDKNMD